MYQRIPERTINFNFVGATNLVAPTFFTGVYYSESWFVKQMTVAKKQP
jgi:hypothetical protein